MIAVSSTGITIDNGQGASIVFKGPNIFFKPSVK